MRILKSIRQELLSLTLETPALKLLTVATSRHQLGWYYQITLLYSRTDAAPRFV